MSDNKKLLLIQLNEINFDMVSFYIKNGYKLPNFKKIYEKTISTSSETEYENLEPWIQWVSIHTGKSYNEHRVFRLGDIVNYNHLQFYEIIEEMGFSVGAISPMNCKNNLIKPDYFVPDPWTDTKPSKGTIPKYLHKSLKQAVNDNSKGTIKLSSYIMLLYCIIRTFNLNDLIKFPFRALKTIGSSWKKSIFLDEILHKIHLSLLNKNNTHFSSIFFNAGAHIQHHYFHSSKVSSTNIQNPEWYVSKKDDPLLEVLKSYDKAIGDYLAIQNQGYDILICTGLSQTAVIKNVFYYRLEDHSNFFDLFSIPYIKIEPRMTRDFLVHFKDNSEALAVKDYIQGISIRSKKVFDHIDVRENELFITLTYDEEIKKESIISYKSFNGNSLVEFDLADKVVFVAIKNGEHSEKGYLFKSFDTDDNKQINIVDIYSIVLNYFKKA